MTAPAESPPRVLRRRSFGRVVLVSISLLSVLFLAVLVGWPSALALMGVLLLHELGHAAALFALGARNIRIVLLPFGGLTLGRGSLQLDPQALFLLGGAGGSAVVGVGGLAIGALTGGSVAAAVGALVLLLALVNLLNLLPFPPLDGGRLLLRLADGRGPWPGGAVRVALVLLTLGAVVGTGGHFVAWVLFVFAVLGMGFFAWVQTLFVRARARGAAESDAPPETAAVPEATAFWFGVYGLLVLLLVALGGAAWSLQGAPAAFARLFPF